ncbi:hypothetical protein TCAL_06359 [Tigriopus californicus]|uniref:Enoyl reductase (ER) domain-containing protein n=1 Tax=Tigriopus californicus TaxID=6832 RepID=A0A553PF82_TIGCA|nr:reticulon-4-interacting protein 1 homolog, mitochondrial-like [Tigriopus californicus]TRY76355.1 hypothetical protein TCAL_06359 [Tigriopus californicus]
MLGLMSLGSCPLRPSCLRRSFSAWRLTAFEGPAALTLDRQEVPVLRQPDDLLVRVHAASFNPLDTAMCRGYGRRVLSTTRCLSNNGTVEELPMILGRDFAGTVEYAGQGCGSAFRPGDAVYGAVFPASSGTWADYVVASKYLTHLKPASLSFEAAAALPYAGLTAWSALAITAGIVGTTHQPRRVLLLGASGGVGHIALQLLHAWDCQVVAVCSSANQEFIRQQFKPSHTLSYQDPNYAQNLSQLSGFDVILDCSGQKAESFTPLLKSSPEACFVSLDSPLLSSTDNQGLIRGGLSVLSNLIGSNVKALSTSGGTVRWGYFGPVPGALGSMSQLVEQNRLKPVIDRVFDFQDMPLAMKHVQNRGGQRGKVVLRVKKEE